MIRRESRQIIWVCDTCDEEFKAEPDEPFAIAWNSAKREGWKTRKIGSEWVHGCPNCGVD